MKTFFSLVIAALYPFVKCSSQCSCRPLQSILLVDNNLNVFRDPWPFLKSMNRLYLKYMPPWNDFKYITCVISEFTSNHTLYSVERNVSWTNLSKTPRTRESVEVEIKKFTGTRKSNTEFQVITDRTTYDFDTLYADSKCLILKISQTYAGQLRGNCFLWLKEADLKDPLRHCYFFYTVLCAWEAHVLEPTPDCDKRSEIGDKNLPNPPFNKEPDAARDPR
uniref:Putative salivary lipocalin n=1 Tax=Ixodes ricinus TaxID=34613 RepID=A0A0K8R8I6_IXORI